jgi:prepilin-type N-terminal cleavage/methylation domain-containing protein
MMKHNPLQNEDGLTLVELMIVMALSLLLMAAVYMTFQLQNASGQTQHLTAATQQDLRAAMETISYDIMHAGLTTSASQAEDPALSQGIPSNSSDGHVLRMTMEPPDQPAEDIEYIVVNQELRRVDMLDNTFKVLARNIINLDFTYYGRKLVGGVETMTRIELDPGEKLTETQAQTVRFIKVRIEKNSDKKDPDTRQYIQRAIERTVCRRNGAINLMD